jgi:hypothetical protein
VRRLTTGKKSGEDDFSWDPKAGTIGEISGDVYIMGERSVMMFRLWMRDY